MPRRSTNLVEHGAAALQTFEQDVPLLTTSDSHSMIEIHFSAKELVFGGDTFTKADPFARLSAVSPDDPTVALTEFGRTEVIKNTTSPAWHTGLKVAYHFEEQQLLKLEIWDEDKKGSSDLRHHTFQGAAVFSLAELMTSPQCALAKDLTKEVASTFGAAKPKYAGSVIIQAEELASCSEFLQLGLCGRSLANKGRYTLSLPPPPSTPTPTLPIPPFHRSFHIPYTPPSTIPYICSKTASSARATPTMSC